MMKHVHDIIQRYHHWPGTHPIPPSNQVKGYEVGYASNKQKCPPHKLGILLL
jgi:hypothetical protein